VTTTTGWRALNIADVGRRLSLPSDAIDRLAPVQKRGGPEVALPDDALAEQLLAAMAVDGADREATLTARPDERSHPELWWVLDRSFRLLLAQMGQRRAGNPGWAPLPETCGPIGRHLFVWAFLAVTPHVRDYHSSIGMTDDESRASLCALGGELASGRQLTGRPGLDATWGLPMVFTGVEFALGRLSFDRQPRQPNDTNHSVLRANESSLNTHIPGGHGPLTPAACDASFTRALELSDQFPEPVVGFCCHSWLMDPQLRDYLPASSNIVQFQRRFTHFTDREQADWAPIENVFHRRFDGPEVPPTVLSELPQRTSLQRAIVTHLQRGGHWYDETGWFRVERR
jgi:hypothetical protein